MLLLSAVFPDKEESFNETIVSPQKVIELFGLQDLFRMPMTYFKLSPHLISINPLTKQEQVSGGIRLAPEFAGNFKGADVSLRFYKRAVKKTVSGVGITDYLPKRVHRINNKVNVIDNKQDLEIAVFLFLNPKNGDSPISDGTDTIYYHYDPNLEARKELALERKVTKVKQDIFEGNIDELRTKCLTFAHNQKMAVYGSQNLSLERIQTELLRKLKTMPTDFVKIWEGTSGVNKYIPFINKAIDNGILTREQEGSQFVCKWADFAFDGVKLSSKVLTKCSVSEDLITAIENTLKNDDKMLDHLMLELKKKDRIDNTDDLSGDEKLKSAIDKADKEIEDYVKNVTNILQVKMVDLVKHAAAKKLLYCDNTSLRIYHMDTKGEIEGEAFAEITTFSNWENDLIKILNRGDMKKQKASFRKTVFEKLKTLIE